MRTRLTITLKHSILQKLDSVIDGVKIRNRSHAIEYLLNKAFYSEQITTVILAGGEGERMRPLTYELPKSMLPVNNKPLLFHLITLLKKHHLQDIIICTNKQGESIKDYFQDGSRFGVNLNYQFEKTGLGTGGALLTVKKQIQSSPFLVIYSDIYTQIDLKELISFHQASGNLVTLGLKPVNQTRKFGQINLKGSLVTEFFQKPRKSQSNLVNSGIYICNQEIFNFFPKAKTGFNLDDVLIKLIQQKQVSGYVFDGAWFDVGTVEDYDQVIKAARGV